MSFYESIGKVLHILSVIILGLGSLYYFARRLRTHPEFGIYITGLFFFELLSRKIGDLIGNNNLLIFSISAFFHFASLTFIYTQRLFHLSRSKTFLIILVGAVPLIVGFGSFQNTTSFQSYDRVVYDLVILIYALILYYGIVLNNKWPGYVALFNGTVLLFFSIDLFLAIGTNFLINENLHLVSWFWTGRAICLQLFYGFLIYFIWKDGKTRPHPLSG